MAGNATVTSTVTHLHGGQTITTDSVSDTTDASLSGVANENGTSTHSEVPNKEGGSTTIDKTEDLPEGKKLQKANVTIQRSCEGENFITLSGEGNVSATARIDGNCILVTEVNRSTKDGDTVVKTNTKKKCCGEE